MKKQINALTTFLDSEVSDWSMDYDYEVIDSTEDYLFVDVTIKHLSNTAYCSFRISRITDELEVELSESSYYSVCDHNFTVKYFWIKVAPSLFI